MPRRSRRIGAGVPYHLTQRGVERRRTFSDESDFLTYPGLLRDQLEETRVQVRGWCLMSNHLHLVAVPQRDDGPGTLLLRGHGRYAQDYNARWGRTGHLWQSRYFACGLEPAHLWRALAYVERNPVRAGLVTQAVDYRWSSARAHLTGGEAEGIVDLEWWEREKPANWEQFLGAGEMQLENLRQCTYAGRPFGDEAFMISMRESFGRTWQPGRPRKPTPPTETPSASASQLTLFG